MNALAQPIVPAAEVSATDDVLIHVRFAPNADIFTIDRLPEGQSGKAWFEHLYANASSYYRTFANGRGFFRIPASVFATL
ncbi:MULTISPECIES: hypothetical protein [Xanthobacter]|uniref:Uncharacterized protein n=1 Tax=Xanthobacter flavus TaxID=281 RepID=A0A9W6CSF0_XANFL|nr:MULTISPECIES: hypothetical protein [Xanthobacter]MBN8915361.1 hypothetical protein [Hyphomicrobiales bacterium]MDR6336691.1 hypothetical protein [Xanthobacter flavus]NMN59676.1 hypothetical protein [Xanthobacter sp. SG618]UDQ91159.1 hypothetical protein LJE71_09280 [Xanthobacter autotrophicus]UJX46594.1 hypothetical protein D7006_19065 [Xanthobacter sp. YC-JY1]